MNKLLLLCLFTTACHSSAPLPTNKRNYNYRTPPHTSRPLHKSGHVIDMPNLLAEGRSQLTPTHAPTNSPEVQIEQIRAISKKRIACYIAATAITSSVLTAVVTMTIHFTECGK